MNEKSKSTTPNLTYKLPNGDEKEFEKLTRVTKSTGTVIDHFIFNSVTTTKF